ncbi:c-type cytochrome [Halomonas denitrificans]|nr:c-type cytochrome [Halomonas denitrificans]
MHNRTLITLALLGQLGGGFSHAVAEATPPQALACTACHQVGPDAKPAIGPPLWGLAERDIASYPGFEYSDALKQHQGQWNAERLDRFLADPNGFSPGTKMVFAGVSDPASRAALIAWLASQNPTPPEWQSAQPADAAVSVGPLKPGNGAELVAAACSGCHSLHLVTQQGLSRDSWQETLDWMVDEQGMAPLPEDDLQRVLDYLAAHYGLE